MRILLIDHSQYNTSHLLKTIEVAEALAQFGHKVTLIATSKTKRFSFEHFSKVGVEFVLSPSLLWGKFRNGADLWDASRRIAFLKSHEFDLVHAWDCRPTVIFPALYMKFIRKVTFIHEWDDLLSMEGTIGERSGRFYQSTLGRLESAFDSHFRKYGDAHIVVSEYLKNRLIRMGVPADRILANYHYGSRYADKLPLSVSEARQKSGIFTDKFILAYAGKMFIRDADLFYKVLNALPETIKANMKLLIINTALPYNLADAGIDVLSFDRLSDDDFFIHLCTANAFILPYQLTIANLARWPSKFADYCSIGRAVLSTPIADLPAIYQEYQPGILTKDDSVSDLLNGICQLVENTSKTIEMGERAKAYAYNELRLSILAQQLDGFYKNVLLGKP